MPEHTRNPRQRMAGAVQRKAQRKLRARQQKDRSVWFGFGMFGLIGWTVAVPTIAGIAVGVWIDKTWQSPYSWTLMCLFAGMITGCIMAWRWVKQESGEE